MYTSLHAEISLTQRSAARPRHRRIMMKKMIFIRTYRLRGVHIYSYHFQTLNGFEVASSKPMARCLWRSPYIALASIPTMSPICKKSLQSKI